MFSKLLITATFLTTFASAVNIPVNHSNSLDITIYNNNLGFLQENKSFKVPQNGYHFINYEGVANSIIIDSVIPQFSNDSTVLYSQNFEQNEVNYRTILEYYKANNLEVQFFETTTNENKKNLATGKVISNVQNPMTIQKSTGTVHTVSISDIYFKNLPNALQKTKPSLSWKVFSKAGKQNVNLKYLMNNITWKSNYTLNLEEDYANLKGWITIDNNTGITFDNANIFCLAGEVNKVTPERNLRAMAMKAEMVMDSAMPVEVKEQSLSGYHLYTIPFKETISKGSKQINFIQKPEVSYKQIAHLNLPIPTYQMNGIQKRDFDNMIIIDNSETNGLGLPLPAGIVRVFSKDEENRTHFIGENRLSHTANNEEIKLTIGKFFDIKAQVKQTEFESKRGTFKDYLLSTLETKITNEDKEKRTIYVDQIHSGYGRYILQSNCDGQLCKEEKITATMTRYIITIESGKTFTLLTSYERN